MQDASSKKRQGNGQAKSPKKPNHDNSNRRQQQRQPQQQQQRQQRQQQPANLRKVSHALSWALRHGAPALKLTMTSDGFVPLQEILDCSHKKLQCCHSASDIRTVVETNDKQRFALVQKPAAAYSESRSIFVSPPDNNTIHNNDNSNNNTNPDDETTTTRMIWCIRANQGHSIAGIDPHALLTRLENHELAALPVMVHGTYLAAWKDIQRTGYLSIMKRHHIHFAAGLLGEEGVISGMRRTCQVYIYVDAGRCARDEIVFFRSDNGVLLTAGIEGKLPLKYVSHVTDSKGVMLLDQREEK